MNESEITISLIHKTFVPQYDRWHGKLAPRIKSWFEHIIEVIQLYSQGNKPYTKHGRTLGICREHSKTEFGDWLWLSAEITWMLTGIELRIVPKRTLQRMWDKMAENRTKAQS
jgi:hypothetical protein